jgi:hypothetical protein
LNHEENSSVISLSKQETEGDVNPENGHELAFKYMVNSLLYQDY